LDFDQPVERRGTSSLKWERYPRDVLPFWVADMDFVSPPAVVEALTARAEHGVYGYTLPPASLVQTTVDYLETRYGWSIAPDWLVWLPSLVTGITLSCMAAADAGDEVMTVTPAYPPFLSAPARANCHVLSVPAVHRGGRWQLPLEEMERAVTPRTRIFLLCHPHNPLGRAWQEDELAAVLAFCRRHALTLCSDEIHCDLYLDPVAHVPSALLADDARDPLITLMSPSKTYNMPGLNFAFAVIPDAALRTRFERAGQGLLPSPGCFAVAGVEAAYRHGGAWLTQLLGYLRANRDLVEEFVRSELANVSMTHVEATYLAWLDTSRLGLSDPQRACLDAGIALSPGSAFGDSSFLRLNFACPRSQLREGLRRMARALG